MNKELKYSYAILHSVIVDKSYVSIELNKVLESVEKSVNTATITKIVYGVLEHDITLDYFVSQFVKKSPSIDIMILLKMVAYCSKAVNGIPPFALVNEIVDLSKSIDRHQSGFVNAVSKKLISSEIVLPSKSNVKKYLSVKYNFPEWVISELLQKHDVEFVTALVSKELPTLTHIRINEKKIPVADFKKQLDTLGIKYTDSLYGYTLYVDYARLLDTNLMQYVIVQGLPSIVTCNVLGAEKGKVLDTCAAPGGKAVYLASNPDVVVYACDIHPHRVDLIRKYAGSCGVTNIKFFAQDATKEYTPWLDLFDYVLCDVPCSNLGVSRKKPDVFLNKSLSDVKTLAGMQYAILENSAKYVKSGGVLQYSTCTILDNENKDVITKFLKNHKDFELTPINVAGLNLYNDNNMYTFYPNMTGTEGFFIARMKRK